MKYPQLLALAALVASAVPVRAQVVVQPEPPLDSIQSVVHDALYLLRDSLQYVEAASARFARDRNMSSDAVLRSRAQSMAERCGAVVRITGEVKEVVVRSARPVRVLRAGRTLAGLLLLDKIRPGLNLIFMAVAVRIEST